MHFHQPLDPQRLRPLLPGKLPTVALVVVSGSTLSRNRGRERERERKREKERERESDRGREVEATRSSVGGFGISKEGQCSVSALGWSQSGGTRYKCCVSTGALATPPSRSAVSRPLPVSAL
jgi:hypothetical protein